MFWSRANNTTILRDVLITILGGKCSCQGENCWHDSQCRANDKRCLQIDHIRGDGAADRKRLGGSAIRYYLKHTDETKSNLQVLCANCNWVKRVRNDEVRGGNGCDGGALVIDDGHIIIRLVSHRLASTPRFLELTDKFYGFQERLMECADADMFNWLAGIGLSGNRSLVTDLVRHWKRIGECDDSPGGLAKFVDAVVLNLDSIIAAHDHRVFERAYGGSTKDH